MIACSFVACTTPPCKGHRCTVFIRHWQRPSIRIAAREKCTGVERPQRPQSLTPETAARHCPQSLTPTARTAHSRPSPRRQRETAYSHSRPLTWDRIPRTGQASRSMVRGVTRSALVVLVAEAESIVAAHRLLHDPTAARGVPAHVTVLHPFRSVVDDATAAEVERIAADLDRFDATFTSVGRFPGEVVFLQPEPEQRFRRISRTFIDAFVDCPPYDGAFPDPHPHLTIGSRVDRETADKIERAITEQLPIATRVDRLTLLVEDDAKQWTIGRSWPLRNDRGRRPDQQRMTRSVAAGWGQ